MKALILIPRPHIRGPIPRVAPLLVSELRSSGLEVITEPWGRRRDTETTLDKVCGRTLDIARIRRSVSRQRPDVMLVVTAHDLKSISRDLPLLLATRRLCPRIVLQFHGTHSGRLILPGSRLLKATSAWLLRLSDAVLLLSTEEQREWQRFYPRGDFRVVANPYSPAGDGPLAFSRSDWVLPTDRPLLLFAGRLMAEKGIFDLLEAMPKVLGRTPCHLLVLGSGGEEQRIRARVGELNLAPHVTLPGYLQGEQLRAAYRLADVFVLPTFWDEGFPTVISEAMDAGLPIVTTRLRGAADYLREGEHALYVPPRDPEALADALLHLLARPALRRQMGQANRNLVQVFAPERVAPHYLQIMQEVVEQR